MKPILIILLVLSSALALLGVSSYRAGNGLGIVPLIGGTAFAAAVLTVWILVTLKERKDGRNAAVKRGKDDF